MPGPSKAITRRRSRAAARALAVVLGAALATAVSAGAAADRAGAAASAGLPAVEIADLRAVLAAVRAPGATAVLVNVWATWCDPCRQEMPELLRFYRAHRAEGLRLVLVSADDQADRDGVARFLAAADVAGARLFIKTGDDMAFINGLDPRWSGALPASFLFDGLGRRRQYWPGPVSYRDLENGLATHGRRGATTKNQRGQP